MKKWSSKHIIGFDFETSGDKPEYALQPWRVKQGAAWATSLVWSVDGKTYGGLNPSASDMKQMLQYAIDNNCVIVGWNVAFDIAWLFAYGLDDLIYKAQWLDGMLLWKHATNRPDYDGNRKSYGLKACVAELLPESAGYEDGINFHTDDPDELKKLHEYNQRDVEFTLHCSQHWFNKLTDRQKAAAFIEAESLPMVAQANYEGLTIDMTAVEELQRHLETVAQERLAQLAPYGVTEEIIRSSAQLAELLFDKWGLEPIKNTESGARSTDKETLHELSLIDDRVRLLREYREALNNKAKFADTPAESVAYNGDGRTHPEARIFSTYSGRMSYSSEQTTYREEITKKGTTRRRKTDCQTGFALHQEKRGNEFRSIVVAPPGYTLLEYDAASQEFRWMSIMSRDPVMQELCAPGADAHAYMGKQIVGEDAYAKDPKPSRQIGKLANLSLQYRTSAKKLLTVARTQYKLPMEIDEATNIRNTYLSSYKNVPKYWDRQIAKAKRSNSVETLAGRIVYLNDSWAGQYKWSMESTSINFPIQSVSADQKYLALKILKPILRKFDGRLYFELHDGLFVIIPDAHVQEAIPAIKHALDNLPYQKEWGFAPPIQMPWDCKVGRSWGSLTEYKFEELGGEGKATKPCEPLSSTIAAPMGGDPDLLKEGRGSPEMQDDTVVAQRDKPRASQGQEAHMPQSQALSAALKLAQAGIKVFPAKDDGAPVYGFKWGDDASSDPETIERWFTETYKGEATTVGMPCGLNDVVVIDPDVKHGAKKGVEHFLQLLEERGLDLADTPMIHTPSGGRHYVFKQPSSVRVGCTKGSLPADIDVKGDGGYVIALGSIRGNVAYKQDPNTPDLLAAFKRGSLKPLPDELVKIVGANRIRLATVDGVDVIPEGMSKELLEKAIKAIPNDDYFEDRETWVDFAHAIKGACGGADWGRDLWVDWCNTIQQPKPNEPEIVWDGIVTKNIRSGAGMIRAHLERVNAADVLEEALAERADKLFDGEDDDDNHIPDALEGVWFDGDSPPEPSPHLIEDYVVAQGLMFIGGQSGAGKSFTAIQMSACLATGSDFFKKKVIERVGTIYVAAEGKTTIAPRLGAAKIGMFADENLPIAVVTDVPDLMKQADRKIFIRKRLKPISRIIQKRFGVRVGAVVIDTMAAAFGMDDEQASAEAARLCKMSQELGDAIGAVTVLVHHYGKDASAGLRGSSNYRALADKVLAVLADRNEETGDCRNRRLVLTKNRDGEEGERTPFDLISVAMGHDQNGKPFNAARIELTTPEQQRQANGIPQQQIDAILDALRTGEHGAHPSSNDWAGFVVGRITGLSPSDRQGRGRGEFYDILRILEDLEIRQNVIQRVQVQRKGKKKGDERPIFKPTTT